MAERFLAAKIERASDEKTDEVESAEAEVLLELQEIRSRLQSLEQRLGRRA
jgi:predicted phage-related endonuclease